VLALAASVAGCGPRFGDGEGEISGEVCFDADDPENCDDYRLTARWVTVEPVGRRAIIEMQTRAGEEIHTDNLLFLVADYEAVAEAIGEKIPLAEDGLVRPQLHLIRSYGFDHYPVGVLAGDGSFIRFASFGTEEGDSVEAVFRFDLAGREDGEARGWVEGWFKLDVTLPFPGNHLELDDY